jgi:GNAT superfamily N-acetyltransferase
MIFNKVIDRKRVSDVVRIESREYRGIPFKGWSVTEYLPLGSNSFFVSFDFKQVGCFDESAKFSYFLDLKRGVSHRGQLYLPQELRGRKLGRKLVESREAACRELGVENIVIACCDNDSFWKHMKYKVVGKFQQQKFTLLKGVEFPLRNYFEPPMYKRL